MDGWVNGWDGWMSRRGTHAYVLAHRGQIGEWNHSLTDYLPTGWLALDRPTNRLTD